MDCLIKSVFLMPKLGFKLWIRKEKKLLYRSIKKVGKHITAIITLGITIWGIILTLRGTRLANASYELSKNDTSQQAQIIKLKEILQHQKIQVDTLVAIIQELRKINKNSDEQTKLLSGNAKPTFRIYDYSANINENGNFEISVSVKNIGQRPANDLSNITLVLNYEKNKIISHEVAKNLNSGSQINLSPSGEINYSFISDSKYKDLDKIITVFRFIYFDNAVNKRDTSSICLKHIINSNNGQYYEDIGGPFKQTILNYLKQRGF